MFLSALPECNFLYHNYNMIFCLHDNRMVGNIAAYDMLNKFSRTWHFNKLIYHEGAITIFQSDYKKSR